MRNAAVPGIGLKEKAKDKDSKKASQNTCKFTIPLQVAFQSWRFFSAFVSHSSVLNKAENAEYEFHSPATPK